MSTAKYLARRVEAAITTTVICAILSLVLTWAVNTVFPLDQYLIVRVMRGKTADILTGGFVWLVPLLWFVLDGAFHRATYGMRSRKLVFVFQEAAQASRLRSLCRIAMGIVLMPVLPVTVVVALADRKHRTIADLVCSTTVGAQGRGKILVSD